MSRDYKAQSNSKASGKSGSSLMLGLFIGYALGLISAMGIWMYISKTPSPFIAQERPAESAVKSDLSLVPKGGPVIGKDDKSAQTKDGKPRFEFYKILPGSDESAAAPQPLPQQAAPQPVAKDSYFIQAGSFQSAEDAENLKAKLAMMGVEASVHVVDLADKGIWHRVRVGPLTDTAEIGRVRASMQQNGIQNSMIKVQEGTQ